MYVCRECGARAPRWEGRCSRCGAWGAISADKAELRIPMPLREMAGVEHDRRPTGIGELDRVLGGGAVPGSVILVGGEPGVGKSTLLLQFAARAGPSALYIAGEESPAQVARRARRLGYGASELALVDCTDSEAVAALLVERRPAFAVVDSVQTLRTGLVEGAPGQPAQMRAAAERLVPAARASGVALFLVGQVNKEGGIAGPRLLEHAVDVVCHLEGDRQLQIRALRGLKNRYGPTDETGLFEMREEGLVELRQASPALLAGRGEAVPGTVVGVALAGTRALCLEAQALIVPNKYAPKRRGQGIDTRRIEVLVACVQSVSAGKLAEHDVFANVVGGLRLRDTGIDLALATALLGTCLRKTVPRHMVAIGEVGLRGEVRGVGQMTARLKEARAMGFKVAYVPRNTDPVDGIQLVEVGCFDEVLLAHGGEDPQVGVVPP